MKYQSVRELKQELLQPVLNPVVYSALSVPKRALRRAGVSQVRAEVGLGVPSSRRADIAMALGVTRGAGRNDYHLGVRIRQEPSAATEAVSRMIRARSAGECDIRYVPEVRKRNWFQGRRRPLEAGLSVGHFLVTAGTLGAIVHDDTQYYILSNNHVLADTNRAQAGDLIFQPGRLDIPKALDETVVVGRLERYVPISFQDSNSMDAAIARVLPDEDIYAGWNEAVGSTVTGPSSISRDDIDRPVIKVGRTTGVTRGYINQIGVDELLIDLADPGEAPRDARFDGQFEIVGFDSIFSAGGDSGSLIVTEDRRALGLLFAGGPDDKGVDLTFATPIGPVLKALRVSLT
jgi:hypothetical protein